MRKPAPESSAHYGTVAAVLHGLMAVLIAVNLLLGFWMQEALAADQPGAARAFQWHKSLGLTILLLSVVRLSWRLLFPPPSLPGGVLNQRLAHFAHICLYGLMVLIPLSGWLVVSTQWRGDTPQNLPTLWFGLIEIPHLLGLDQAEDAVRKRVWGLAAEAHVALIWLMLALLGGHIGAAFWHQRQDNAALGRMFSWRRRQHAPAASPMRRLIGAALPLLAIAAALWAVNGGRATESAARSATSAAQDEAWLSAVAPKEQWVKLTESGRVEFSGKHDGRTFEGSFQRGFIALTGTPAVPESLQLRVLIDTASTDAGLPLYDRTLREPEWFDVQRYPYARFELLTAQAVDGKDLAWRLSGALRIKQQEVLVDGLELLVEAGAYRISGKVLLDRTTLDLGMESDPGGEYVSLMISVNIAVRLPAPD